VNRRASQNKRSGSGGMSITHPPQFNSNILTQHKFRYLCTGSNALVNITRANFLNSLLVNLSGSTSNTRLIAGVRIKKVEIWSPCSNSTLTISWEWLSNLGPSSEISDTTSSASFPAHISTKPPPNSLCGFWSITGQNESEVIAILTAPVGSVLDATIEYYLFDGEGQVSVTTAASGVLGTLYNTRFDGPAGGAVMVPVSYVTIN